VSNTAPNPSPSIAGPPPPAEELFIRQRFSLDKPLLMDAFGRKGTGKSFIMARYWDSWPPHLSALAIDPTHDFADMIDREHPGFEVLTDPLPYRLPLPERDQPGKRWVYFPDMGSATADDDLDRAVGLAFYTPKDVPFLLHVDEDYTVSKPGSQCGPNTRRMFYELRHRRLFATFAGPRPYDVNTLELSQADYVYIFYMPHPRDQQRIAEACGIKPDVVTEGINALGEHEYLRFDAHPDPELVAGLARAEGMSEQEAKESLRLVHMPALPDRPPRRKPQPPAQGSNEPAEPAEGIYPG
jgi:hypothetical protein